MKIAAYDSANPEQKVITEMLIDVNRNVHAPRFTDPTIEQTILGNTQLGAPILEVAAQDQDQDKLKYSILTDERCQEYFYMNPDTGIVTLKKLLEDESLTKFLVRFNRHGLLT